MKKVLFRVINKILKWHQYYQHELIRKKYNIPKSFGFNSKDIRISGDGEFIAGENSYICSDSVIQVIKGCKVVVGKGCSISHNVKMYTSTKLPDYDFRNKREVPEKMGDIIIGDYVWIGVNVIISPGVTIGDNAVVGANSVVTSDIEPYCIYGGVPAKLIRKKNKVIV